MIEGIDIFAPRESGLPDFTKISPAQIFNGSVAASLNSMKDPLGIGSTAKSYTGVPESPFINTSIDPRTGRRVEIRKANVVDELLDGGSAKQRGHRRINGSGSSNSYSVPGDTPEPPLPVAPETPANDSLLNVPPPGWHPPMAPDYQPVSNDGNILLFPPELTPEEKKQASLRKLPTMLLEELKNLRMIS
jgi:hypothetical protein